MSGTSRPGIAAFGKLARNSNAPAADDTAQRKRTRKSG